MTEEHRYAIVTDGNPGHRTIEDTVRAVDRYLYQGFSVVVSLDLGAKHQVLVTGTDWAGFTMENIGERLRSGHYGVRIVDHDTARKEMRL